MSATGVAALLWLRFTIQPPTPTYMRPLLAFVPLRRAILLATAAISAAPPHRNQAAATSPETASKIEADLRRRAEEVRTDVAYPPAIIGEWQCARRIELIEGDVADAEAVYKSLGGSGGFHAATGLA